MNKQKLTVSSGYAHLLSETLLAQGIDMSGEKSQNFDENKVSNNQMPIDVWNNLLTKAAQYTNDGAIGLAVGQRIQPHHLGILGYALMASSTVKELLRRYARYHGTIARGFPIQLITTNNHSTLTWQIAPQFSIFHSNVCAVTAMLTILRYAIKKPIYMPENIGFVGDQPKDIQPYYDALGKNLSFNNDAMSITIDNDLLDTPLIGADRNLVSILHKDVEKLLLDSNVGESVDADLSSFELKSSIVIRLRKLITKSLAGKFVSIDSIAEQLNLSKRSLGRRLSEQKTNYRKELNKVQEQLSKSYLEDGRIPIVEVAQLVGFEDQSSFTRAFKKWTGKTPGAWQTRNI